MFFKRFFFLICSFGRFINVDENVFYNFEKVCIGRRVIYCKIKLKVEILFKFKINENWLFVIKIWLGVV